MKESEIKRRAIIAVLIAPMRDINTDFETLGCLYDEYTAAKKREEKWELYQEEQLIEDEYERDVEERELQDEMEISNLTKI